MTSGHWKPSRQIILIAIAIVLALVVAADRWRLSGADMAPVAAPPDDDAKPIAVRADQPFLGDIASYSEAFDRPLFSATRRAQSMSSTVAAPSPRKAPVRAEAPQTPPPMLELLGVAIRAGADASAIIRVQGETFRVFSGDPVGDWYVSGIESRSLTLERDGETQTYLIAPVQ